MLASTRECELAAFGAPLEVGARKDLAIVNGCGVMLVEVRGYVSGGAWGLADGACGGGWPPAGGDQGPAVQIGVALCQRRR